MAGLGSLSSSRLTKLLQEKAELLKKKRQTAEALQQEIEERLKLLRGVGIEIPDTAEKLRALQDLERKSDWEGLETQARAFLDSLNRTDPAPIDARRADLAAQADRLAQLGRPLPADVLALLAEVLPKVRDGHWKEGLDGLSSVDGAVDAAAREYVASLGTRILTLGRWSGAEESPPELAPEVSRIAREAIEHDAESGGRQLSQLLLHAFPGSVERRNRSRALAERAIPPARDLGVPTTGLQGALDADARAFVLDWPESVGRIDQELEALARTLRERVTSTVAGLRGTLEGLRSQGVDPDEALAALEQIVAQAPSAGAVELPGLLAAARESAEGPVVAVVAGLLDEVRPGLVEARRLGRNPSEVFAAMNRAREALRLRIYGEAIAAGQEALDRVTHLIEDVEGIRSEAESVREMLGRLAQSGFAPAEYEAQVGRALQQLDDGGVDQARKQLRATINAVGRAAVGHFDGRIGAATQLTEAARERGFLPAELATAPTDLRRALDEGRLADVGALLGRVEVELRAAAAPYMARRLEEMDKGLVEIPDEPQVTAVRAAMADADVSLRVKEDLATALDRLRQAEHEFSGVFAARASSLVESLAQERKVLEEMGGAGDAIQREIDEVEQIFNMGDFVKASRSAQEIRTRILQQQLVRSEEAVSHAKLSLVELETMGLDVSALRADLEQAQEAAKLSRYSEAFRNAEATNASARRLRSEAQEILDLLAETAAGHASLVKIGQSPESYRTSVQEAKAAYQALDFGKSRAVLAQLREELQSLTLRTETGQLLDEARLLAEDGHRLSVPMEGPRERIASATAALGEGRLREASTGARAVHEELVGLIRPVLEETLRALEADSDTARGLGLDVAPVLASLNEARRRLGQPVPTGVAAIIEGARVQFFESRGFLEHAERVLRRATDALNQGELVRVDVAAARERLHRIQRLIADREYPKAIELASSVERELNQATVQQISKTLAGFQGLVARTRRSGVDTTLAENFLQQARNALDNSQPIEALQLAARAESEIERVELQQQIARSSLETMEQRLTGAGQEGVVAPAATEELGRARTAFARHDYVEVLEMALACSDSLSIAREYHRRASEAVEIAERQRAEAAGLSAELGEAASTLQSARELAAAGQYVDAIRRARESAEKSRWAIERLYSGGLEETRRFLETVQRWVPESAPALAEAIDDAEASLKAREWTQVTDRLKRARGMAEVALGGAVDARRDALRSLYDRLIPFDATEKERRAEVLRRLAEFRGRGAFVDAFEQALEEEQRLAASRNEELRRRVQGLEEALLVGEKLGLDTTPVMQLFSEGKLALGAGKADEVVKYLDRALAQLDTILKPRLGDKLRDVRAEFVFARDGLNVSLGPVGEILDGLPRLIEKGELVEAARLLLAGEEQVSQRKAQQRELTNLHYIVDGALAQARARGLDVAKAQQLLAESIQARSTDYGIALERARQAHEVLKALLKPPEAAAAPTTFWPFRRPPPTSPPG